MKLIFFGVLTALICYSCKHNKLIAPPENVEFETVETQMAEIKMEAEPQIEILKKDTLEFLQFWKRFNELFQQKDSPKIIKLSLDSIDYSVHKKEVNDYKPEIQSFSIKEFLNSQYARQKNLTFIPYSKKEQSHVYLKYTYNKDTQHLASPRDSALLNYRIDLISKEISGNYDIMRIHSFSFIKVNGSIKFSGLQIGEPNSRFRNDSTTLSQLYFPLYDKTQNSKINLNALDTFADLWYSNSLSSFKEPSLYNYKGYDEIYRFTWLRSFHNPVTIRFQKACNNFILTTKEIIDNNGYSPDKIIVNTTQYLTGSEWNKWESRLSSINFWNLPVLDPEPRPMDGAEWIIEANLKGKYRFTTRTMSDYAYRECCKYLLFLSKLKIPEEDIY